MANEFTIHIDVTASKSESTDKEKLDKVTKGTDTASSSDKKEKKSDDELKDLQLRQEIGQPNRHRPFVHRWLSIR